MLGSKPIVPHSQLQAYHPVHRRSVWTLSARREWSKSSAHYRQQSALLLLLHIVDRARVHLHCWSLSPNCWSCLSIIFSRFPGMRPRQSDSSHCYPTSWIVCDSNVFEGFNVYRNCSRDVNWMQQDAVQRNKSTSQRWDSKGLVDRCFSLVWMTLAFGRNVSIQLLHSPYAVVAAKWFLQKCVQIDTLGSYSCVLLVGRNKRCIKVALEKGIFC